MADAGCRRYKWVIILLIGSILLFYFVYKPSDSEVQLKAGEDSESNGFGRRLLNLPPLRYNYENLTILRSEMLRPLVRNPPQEFNCVTLQASNGKGEISVPICLHNTSKDDITRQILATRRWEYNQQSTALRLMREYKLDLIDIGANIGTYTLPAAALGHRVIAVEPFRPNYLRLATASLMNNVHDRITIVTNLIACCHKAYSMEVRDDEFGMVLVKYDGSTPEPDCAGDKFCSQAVAMDDLLAVTPFPRALMKIDVEAHEGVAFEEAEKFFDAVDIPFILMEWKHVKSQKSRHILLDFLPRRGYTPRIKPDGDILEMGNMMDWPKDIWWTKQDSAVSNKVL